MQALCPWVSSAPEVLQPGILPLKTSSTSCWKIDDIHHIGSFAVKLEEGVEFFYRAVCAKAAVYCTDQVLMGKIAFKGVFTRVHPYRAKTLQT